MNKNPRKALASLIKVHLFNMSPDPTSDDYGGSGPRLQASPGPCKFKQVIRTQAKLTTSPNCGDKLSERTPV